MNIISDPADISKSIVLAGVDVYEVAGRRRDGGFGADSQALESGASPVMQVLIQQTESLIAFRVRCEVTSEQLCAVVADMAITFTKNDAFDVAPAALTKFGESAVMMLYPYLREQLHNVSDRLGAPIVLDVLSAGALRLDMSEPAPG